MTKTDYQGLIRFVRAPTGEVTGGCAARCFSGKTEVRGHGNDAERRTLARGKMSHVLYDALKSAQHDAYVACDHFHRLETNCKHRRLLDNHQVIPLAMVDVNGPRDKQMWTSFQPLFGV